MAKFDAHDLINDGLLIGSFGSFGLYHTLGQLSEICRLMLPITGVISFIIYVMINWAKIKEFFKGN